jgi:hypothetical protein
MSNNPSRDAFLKEFQEFSKTDVYGRLEAIGSKLTWNLTSSAAAIVGCLLAGFGGYCLALIQFNIAAKSVQNYGIVGACVLVALVALGVVSLPRKTPVVPVSPAEKKAEVGMSPSQHSALSLLSSTCLSDPISMDLVQRLSARLADDGRPTVSGGGDKEGGGPRSVPELLRELESRVRHDAVAALMAQPTTLKT